MVGPSPAGVGLAEKESYGDSFVSDLLEQYKLYVQSAENVSSRRVTSNRYLLTINAALVALYGLQSANFGQGYWTSAHSRYRNSLYLRFALVSDHQVTRRPESNLIKLSSQTT